MPWSGDYKMASIHLCFYINLYISFIYGDIFSKFEESVCGYENMPVKFWPHFKKEIN